MLSCGHTPFIICKVRRVHQAVLFPQALPGNGLRTSIQQSSTTECARATKERHSCPCHYHSHSLCMASLYAGGAAGVSGRTAGESLSPASASSMYVAIDNILYIAQKLLWLHTYYGGWKVPKLLFISLSSNLYVMW